MRKALKLAGWLAIALLVLLVIAVAYLYFSTDNPTSGKIKLPGLYGKVTIYRDQNGVPHIHAYKSDNDALFALGFAQAQDRFWQMEFQRHLVKGELSELFGKKTLTTDKFLRTIGFYRAAKLAWQAIDPSTKTMIHSYTMGVNAFIQYGKLPLQFKILGHQPEPWTDIDSIAWQKLMAWDLQFHWRTKIINYLITQKFGEQAIKVLYPPYPANAPTILSNRDLQQANLLQADRDLHSLSHPKENLSTLASLTSLLKTMDKIQTIIGTRYFPSKGSNNWVLSGKFTKSGKPILANDIHLSFSAPDLWYLAELTGPHLHAVGATIPGTPFVIVGHNDHIAWGTTNVNPNTQDLMIEPANASLKKIIETIKIKGAKAIQYPIYISKDGPIISKMNPAKKINDLIALKWTALMPGDTTVETFRYLDYAKNWDDFKNAMKYFVAPSQNFIYADTQGNIGYYLPGKIPVRKNCYDNLPNKADQKCKWTGYIPFEKLPHIYNPPEGFIASANNKATSTAYPFQISARWKTPPFRIERILALLHDKSKLNINDIKKMQNDTLSYEWRELKPILMKTKSPDIPTYIALKKLLTWNGKMDTQQIAPTIFSYWLEQLTKLHPTFIKPIIPEWPETAFIKQQLQNDGQFCRINKQKNCQQFLRYSLHKALEKITKQQGMKLDDWQWGHIHKATFYALGFGKAKYLGWIWNRSIPSPGGFYTVNAGPYDVKTFKQIFGPTYRQIIDLGKLNNSLYVINLGQSGNPFSKHYSDLMQKWRDGKYLKIKNITKQNKNGLLILTPK